MVTTLIATLALIAQAPAAARSPAPGATETLRLQVGLDRAGFSPGAIDGQMGASTRRALAAYTRARGQDGPPDVAPLVTYTITPEDVRGPFTREIPEDLVEQARLPELGYRSALEALAERFHSTPALLERLNPGARFTAGEAIEVPNVEPLVVPVEKPEQGPGAKKEDPRDRPTGTAGRRTPRPADTIGDRPDVVVTVGKSDAALTVEDGSGRVLFHAPVTTGSENDPLPIGEWTVKGVQFTPKFHYNPDLFWDADPSHSKATIPGGPNNPVGLVWIDLDKEHYGIHGTPEPSAIGRSESHGCVRLTNWDALRLAGLVKPGTRVVFTP
jgi:lipoprotein-anchoring transpeptidase ErfK/SrfK